MYNHQLSNLGAAKRSITDDFKVDHVRTYFYYVYTSMFVNNYKYIGTQ